MHDFVLPGGIYNATPERVVFGWGSAGQLAQEIERVGGQPLVVTTKGRRTLVDDLLVGAGLQDSTIIDVAVPQVPEEVTRGAIASAASTHARCLVAIGGGAAIGLAKAMALELDLPVVDVPTTYSGSEMTGFCGITIDGVKRMHMDRRMLARTVIYDPELAATLPISTSVTSALNALAHCVDALVTTTAAPYMRAAAEEGATALLRTLPRLTGTSNDRETRTHVMYGAYLAGAALTGGYGVQHGLAHALGGSFGIEHSAAHAVLLPYVTSFLAARWPRSFAFLVGEAGLDAGVTTMQGALRAVGVPRTLEQLGITENDHAWIADLTMDELEHNPAPVFVDRQDVLGILAAAQGTDAASAQPGQGTV